MKAAFQIFDAIRVDHFRGFAACWEVSANNETALVGRWVPGPGRQIFDALQGSLGRLPIIAEDLGLITPDVVALRIECGFPGMRVLQFAFGGGADNTNLPHNYEPQTVVYTGTHDNDTTVGWFTSDPDRDSTRSREEAAREREYCLRYLGSDGSEIHWDFIRAALSSVADLAIIPAQDLLGLDSRARMNVPARPTGAWAWRLMGRLTSGGLTRDVSKRLREMTETYGRLQGRARE
jgi:4-alpha-glucanotransferase